MREIIKLGTWDGEMLEWLVVAEDDSSRTLLSRRIIKNMPFSPDSNKHYDESDIRTFLNGEFYDTAFSDSEKSEMLDTTVEMTMLHTYFGSFGTYGSGGSVNVRPPLSDKVYIPSPYEVKNVYALTPEEIAAFGGEKLWLRMLFTSGRPSLLSTAKDILSGASPYFYVSESYNPMTDTFTSSDVPHSDYSSRPHAVAPVIRIKR